MRFLHTSDWHIGRRFHHLSLLEDQTFALQQLIKIVQTQHVDAVLIAGDIYDRAVPPTAAVQLVDEVLHTLSVELNVPTLMIAGNHDSAERLGFASRQLGKTGLHIAGQLSQTIKHTVLSDTHGSVVCYLLPYYDPAIVRDIFQQDDIRSYDQATAFLHQHIQNFHQAHYPNTRKLLISHCFVTGGTASDSERLLSVGGSDQVSVEHFLNFDYVALGHLHAPQHCREQHIRYSGSLLKYSFSECQHNKSFTLVDMNENGKCEIQTIPIQSRHNVRILEGELSKLLKQGKQDDHADDYLSIRLTDTVSQLNVMQKLRAVYPHVLHVERVGLMDRNTPISNQQKHTQQNELSVLSDFYQQIQGNPLSEQQTHIITDILSTLHKD